MENFSYHRPAKTGDAVKAMKKAKDGKFLSGGMTLLPTMKQGLASPTDIIDLSGLENSGLDKLWAHIEDHRNRTGASGDFAARRQRQAVAWMRDMLEDRLMGALKANPAVAAPLPGLEAEVRAGRLIPTRAVDRVMEMMGVL